MKEVMIIIRPNKYFETKEKLIEAGFSAMNTKEIIGRGKTKREYTFNAQDKYTVIGLEVIAKKLIDIYVRDEEVEKLIETVLSVNSTNTKGDGKIFILPVDEAIRIRTNQTGEDALV